MILIPLDIIEQVLRTQGITGLNRSAEKDTLSVAKFIALLKAAPNYKVTKWSDYSAPTYMPKPDRVEVVVGEDRITCIDD